MADNIFVNGYNDRSSYGAHSYFIRGDNGTWMVDAPRFTRHLVNKIEALGGQDYIFLTHRDDVADAEKYAAHFSARRVIHALEKSTQPDAEIILDEEDYTQLSDAQLLFTLGHTRGHMALLWQDTSLFVGDHFSPRSVCWFSWDAQIESTEKLSKLRNVTWVFTGHGKWFPVEPGGFPGLIKTRIREMRIS